MGAWIETSMVELIIFFHSASHPVWVRGLKLMKHLLSRLSAIVAPRVGAWIETRQIDKDYSQLFVAPRVGAWIET